MLLQKNTAHSSSTDTATEDKKLIAKRQAEQTLNSIINATIKQKPPSSPTELSRTNSFNFSTKAESMHSTIEEVENKDCDDVPSSVQPNKSRQRDESSSKAQTIFSLDTSDNITNSITSHSNDTKTSEEFSSTMPNAVIEESTVKTTMLTVEKKKEKANEFDDSPGL